MARLDAIRARFRRAPQEIRSNPSRSKRRWHFSMAWVAGFLWSAGSMNAVTLEVRPDAPGSQAPLREALVEVRRLRSAVEPVVIELRGGRYELAEPLSFRVTRNNCRHPPNRQG
jgi:hypothetical protein